MQLKSQIKKNRFLKVGAKKVTFKDLDRRLTDTQVWGSCVGFGDFFFKYGVKHIFNKTTTAIHRKNRGNMNTVTLKGKTSQRMEMFFSLIMNYVSNSFATRKHFIEMPALCQIRTHTILF